MKFCNICDNMLYAKCEDNSHLLYFCKNCNANVELSPDELARPIVDTQLVDDDQAYLLYMTKNIKYDASLPRVETIKCPNIKCSKPEGVPNQVIFTKYNPNHLKFVYFCCHCENFWKTKN